MKMRFEIPDGFWSLFRSVNRETYIEALLAINEEYEYNNYFLTKEACIQVLSDKNAREHLSKKHPLLFISFFQIYQNGIKQIHTLQPILLPTFMTLDGQLFS